MIKNIVFDFGNVLVQYDFMHYLEPLIGSREKTQAFMDTVLTSYWISRIDREDTSLDQIVQDMKEAFPSLTREIDCFAYPVRSYVVYQMPGMYELLSSLKQKGYRLFGLSNWCHMVYSVMEKYDIFTLLEGRVISSEEKLVKPEPEIYQRLLEKYDLKAEECVFIDDRKVNIDASESCGIRGIVFKSAEQLKEELEALLSVTL